MNNKKAFLVILLAILLALISVLFLFKTEKNTDYSNLIEENFSTIEKEVKKVESIETQSVLEAPVVEQEKTIQVTPIETPTIKPLKIEEKEVITDENDPIDAGITKDTLSNDIIITREFKSQSPAKYSFVGFGEQKAPTK